MRLLVVEDDPEIAEGVAALLRADGHVVDVARDGREGLDLAFDERYAALVLDVMLPEMDGWTLLASMRRARVRTPVLMLTARDAVDDRVRGLEGGADDYLVKPFDPRELLARVRALLRREKEVKTGRIEVADLVVDTADRTATRAGEPLRLTPREYALLEALARNVGRVITRETILSSVFDADEQTDNSVSFHVAALRKKVDGGRDEPLIRTVHGFGYSLRTPERGP